MGKTIEDDITLVERDAQGCCPTDTVPGAKHTTTYEGPQVVCGIKDDGSVTMSTGSSNGVKTCTYNSCFVMKKNLACAADGSKQMINGCCATKASCNSNACGFKADCKNYGSSFNNVYSQSVGYCTTYDKDYGTKGYAGTLAATDDVDTSGSEKKLLVDKVYTYTRCAGGSAGAASNGVASNAMTAMLSAPGFGAVALIVLGFAQI